MPASASYVLESSVKVISRSIIMSDEVSDMVTVLSLSSFLDISLENDNVVLQVVVDKIVSLLTFVSSSLSLSSSSSIFSLISSFSYVL